MNLWLINHYAILPQQAGGTRHYTLARELAERGHRVTIVASSFDHTTRQEMHLRDGAPLKLEVVDGVRFLWLKTPPYKGNSVHRLWNTLVFARKVLSLRVADLGGPPDVVLGSSPHLFAAWAAERFANRVQAPFVLEVRDIWPQSLIDLGNFRESHPFIRVLESIERGLYSRAKRVVTLLPGALEHIVHKGGDSERIVWIPNGIDLKNVPQPSRPEDSGSFTVMYAGSHGLANDLRIILEAARYIETYHPDLPIRFFLVGDGPEKPKLMALAEDMGLSSVRFSPPVSKAGIYEFLRRADAFIMPLRDSPVFRWGVSPNKLYDYMAMARPVIFAVNTPFDPIQSARAGITVAPGEPTALAKAAVRLAGMPLEERWAMGLRGRSYVEANHDLRHLADRLEQTLEDAIEMG